MEGLIGMFIWIAIIVAISVANQKRRQKAAGEQGTSSEPKLGDMLRDMARQLKEATEDSTGKAEPVSPPSHRGRAEHQAQAKRSRRRPLERQGQRRPMEGKHSKIEKIEGGAKEAYFETPDQEETTLQVERLAVESVGGVAPVGGTQSYASKFQAADKRTLRDRIVWSEILGKPVALREKSSNFGD